MPKLCIIPARGGSKRIPRKNIKNFCGMPMIARSIQAALHSKIFDKVIVSTDDAEIAEIALSYGAEVPFLRPAELSDDFATTADVVVHGHKEAEAYYKMQFDDVCCLYATAPFVRSQDLQNSALLMDEQTDFIIPVASFPFPIQRAVCKKGDFIVPFSNEDMKKRSQDLIEAYHDAGQFYWGTSKAWNEKKDNIWASQIKPFLLPRNRVQDIDTAEDWEMAESLYQILDCKFLQREVV